jgi:fructose-1,6-bisphosphatase/inositol monophosphatase family enzyme
MIETVTAIIRSAADEAILPRFQKLRDGQIEEKTPGEVVTIADREAERIIAPQLEALLPGSRAVGEEASSVNPSLMERLDEGDVWLVDPLDGTGNFIAGSAEFAVMVALLRQGEPLASWMYRPATGELAVASLGGGAFIDGNRIRTVEACPPPEVCRGAVLTRFLPDPWKEQVKAHAGRFLAILPGTKCAGVDYPAVATGTQNFVMFWRLLPWDHAPGALFVREAGGRVAHLDGSPYRPEAKASGLLVAENEDVWTMVRETLLGPRN